MFCTCVHEKVNSTIKRSPGEGAGEHKERAVKSLGGTKSFKGTLLAFRNNFMTIYKLLSNTTGDCQYRQDKEKSPKNVLQNLDTGRSMGKEMGAASVKQKEKKIIL